MPTVWEECYYCDGEGIDEDGEWCVYCGGHGVIPEEAEDDDLICPTCDGEGCSECLYRGTVRSVNWWQGT